MLADNQTSPLPLQVKETPDPHAQTLCPDDEVAQPGRDSRKHETKGLTDGVG